MGRYRRQDERINQIVSEMFLRGVSTRKEMFVPILVLGITLASNLAAGLLVGIVIVYAQKAEKLNV
jgi:SulP family sulfate permease